MARDFSMVAPALWGSKRFIGVSADAKLVHLYLLTNQHQTSAGAYRLLAGYACVDLGAWQLDRFLAALAELGPAGLVQADAATSEVMIERWFKHCPPTNDRHYRGTAKLIGQLESETLRAAATAALNEAWAGRQNPRMSLLHAVRTRQPQ